MPYTGGPSTGATRASLQRALDNYKTGHINLPVQEVSESDLSRSDTVSFGESHASELSVINSESSLSAANVTPLSSSKPLPSSPSPQLQGPPFNVANLNLSPAPLPISEVDTVSDPAQTLPPTIAETGISVAPDSSSNPGPSSGSLLDLKGQGSTPSATPVVEGQKYESAEEEKKRLAATSLQQTSTEAAAPVEVAPAFQGPSQVAATIATPQSESAEEEKKRLEREERDQNPGQDEDLPPYEDPK
jgi:hypothetical protein